MVQVISSNSLPYIQNVTHHIVYYRVALLALLWTQIIHLLLKNKFLTKQNKASRNRTSPATHANLLHA